MHEHVGHTFSDGCPGLCSGHGRCTLEQSGWRCVCQAGWSGPGCSVVMETDCSDGTDNDGGEILPSSVIFHLFTFLFCLSGRLSLLPCYFLFSFHLNKKRKNQPHCSSPSSHCAVPVLLNIIILNTYLCVCMPLHFVRVCLSAFPLITAKCLICIPPARIKGTQRKFPKSKYSKPCIIDFCFFFAYGCQVSGGR